MSRPAGVADKSSRLEGDARIGSLAGSTIDILQVHSIPQPLAESEAKYRRFIDAAPVILWSASADGLREFHNDRWYELTGARPGSAEGWNWLSMVHPQDRNRVEASVRRCIEAVEPYEIEYRLDGPGGPSTLLERALPMLDDRARCQGWHGACTEIRTLADSRLQQDTALSDLQERHAYLQAILDSVPEAMIIIDEHGIIRSFSPAATAQFGWPASEAIGRNVKMLMPDPYRAGHDGHLSRYLATDERRLIGVGRVFVAKRRDGSTFPMELSIGDARSGGKRFFTGFVRDLSERQAAERRFQRVQAELAHVSRLSVMGELATGLAHELNQPLAATANYIQGSLRLLAEDTIDLALIKDALTVACEQLFRAGDIIARLREFVSKSQVDRQAISLLPVLEEAGVLAMVGTKDDGVRLSFDVPATVGLVLIDKVQVQQVLLNLMRNAVEAMAQSPNRELALAARISDDGMVTIAVADTGPGLSDEMADRLFQPFVTTKRDGMGVGLSICRTIVEAHGGRIWAENNGGPGLTFKFTLEAAPEPGGEHVPTV